MKSLLTAGARARVLAPLLGLMLALGAVSTPLSAQEAEASREAERAVERLKSPFCPGLMLEVCPTDSARVLREEISELAASGLDADSIVEIVVTERGEIFRALPKAQGRGLLAWVAPPLALLLGLTAIFLFLRRSLAPAPPEALAVSDEQADRVREALEELER